MPKSDWELAKNGGLSAYGTQLGHEVAATVQDGIKLQVDPYPST